MEEKERIEYNLFFSYSKIYTPPQLGRKKKDALV